MDDRVIVIDVGKTLAKVSLWTREGRLLDRQTRPNARCERDGIACLDADGIADWLPAALSRYADEQVTAIVPVAHGAAVAAIANGALAFQPLDYEQALPDDVEQAYRQERAPFAETGSPPLPGGLNIGAQLFWLERLRPGLLDRSILLPWTQYWAWFLSGTAVSEVTSLGCHSDLWQPTTGEFSSLARERGWAERFAPLTSAGNAIGRLRPDLAALTGLSQSTRVLAGLHDSNAALHAARSFAEIEAGEATVLSTGTWFIAMRLAADEVDLTTLPVSRDCLVNVDILGQPVPSARFMGGREIETVIEFDTRQVDIKPDQPKLLEAVPALVERGAMLLPTLAPGTGPFPDCLARWIDRPEDWYARRAAVCLYAALVADCSFDLIGSKEKLLIEGRFADAEVFVRALASLRPDTEVYVANAHHDVSFGALRLLDPGVRPAGGLRCVIPLEADLENYRQCWRAALDQYGEMPCN